jgi:hypothetical protein
MNDNLQDRIRKARQDYMDVGEAVLANPRKLHNSEVVDEMIAKFSVYSALMNEYIFSDECLGIAIRTLSEETGEARQ